MKSRKLVIFVILVLQVLSVVDSRYNDGDARGVMIEDLLSCKNGGSELDGEYQKCSCPVGYKGYDCSQKVGVCEGNPCRNSGKCIESDNGTFYCQCSEMYRGLLCEKQVRPCDSQPCKNGGNCSDNGIKCFKCQCTTGFKGSDCSEKILPCELSPCKHGGICSNEDNSGFKCTCRNGYQGKKCEMKDALSTSKILNNESQYIEQLSKWVGEETAWKLCYRASENGWRSNDFHSRCDHKGATLTIIRSGNNIFGGYADVSWGGNAGYRRSPKAFLYSLRNKDNVQPYKADVYRYETNAVYTHPNYGVTFGGGHDLYIRDNARSSGSYSNFGYTYKPPSGYNYGTTKAKSFFAGAYNFIPSEIEVLYKLIHL